MDQHKKRKNNRQKRATVVIVGVLAVLMVLSVLLPSLSSFLMARQAQQNGARQTKKISSMKDVDNIYKDAVTKQEAKVSSDEKSIDEIFKLGNTYMAWAGSASSFIKDDTAKAHVQDLYTKAVAQYEKYLKQKETPEVRTRLYMSQFLAGKTDEARKALEEYTAGEGKDFAMAWLYLGLMYEANQKVDAAKDAYAKAVAADPDNKANVKNYAQSHIDELNKPQKSGSGAQGLKDALGNPAQK